MATKHLVELDARNHQLEQLMAELLLESVVYDGATGELELQFYPLGISRLAAEAAMVGQTTAEAA